MLKNNNFIKKFDKYLFFLTLCSPYYRNERIFQINAIVSHHLLIEDLLGVRLVVGKDKNQCPERGCVQSIDIGEYNTWVVFHRVCPAEHGNLYGEKPNFRTDEPATSIGTDLPGGFRTGCP